jgi:SIR2-like domain
MPEPTLTHFRTVVRAMLAGQVVPLLGAGANLCGRPGGTGWKPGSYPPNGTELAEHLADHFTYPTADIKELSRVSQYVAVMAGSGPLYQELHRVFDADYPPSQLHQLLASVPRAIRRERQPRNLLIVTTNYDDALERAFQAAGEEFDLVSYVAEGDDRGKFAHLAPDGKVRLVDRPNEYVEVSPDRRTVILKIHGAVDRRNAERDSFVITEDHYIDYLARNDVSSLIPITLAARLQRSHFLFLGYSLRDWNLRVILRRIWGSQALTWKSWAIQLEAQPIDEEFWRGRGVEILHAKLDEYVVRLTEQLEELESAGRQ